MGRIPCLKRSIRRSPEFQELLKQGGGVRTRRLVFEIAKAAAGREEPPNDLLKRIREVFEDGGVTFPKEPPKDDPHRMEILWFVPDSAIKEMGEAAKKPDGEDLAQRFAAILKIQAAVPDIQPD